jgi:Cof subfamily protein (haloacid dehalogenase superfamily)
MKLTTLSCIFTDLDGSLLNGEHKIGDADLAVIKLLKNKGIPVFIATGRHVLLAKDAAASLGFDFPICACNGGHIYDFSARRTLFMRVIPPSVASRLYSLLSESDFDFVIYTPDRVIFRSRSVRYFQLEKITASFAPENRFTPHFTDDGFDADNEEILKFLIRREEPHAVAREIAVNLGEDARSLSMSCSGATLLEINAAGVNKGEALRKLAEMFGFRPEETMALGDSDNDAEMLRAAGIPVAPQNADDKIKAIASYITTDHTESPLFCAVSKLFPSLLE